MTIEIPPCRTIEDEMAALGVPDWVSELAYRWAREDLLAARIDLDEVAEVACRYERELSAE